MNKQYSHKTMYVIKRDGNREPVKFDKITDRIKNLTSNEELKFIDPTVIAQKVVKSLFSGISTEDLDLESAKICANLNTTHPLYSILAGRILISNLAKKTNHTFSEKLNIIQNFTKEQSDSDIGLLDTKYLKWVNNNKDEINNMIDYSRDFDLDYFGFKTLERAYLIRNQKTKSIIERPQDMWMRVASFLNQGDLKSTKITYDLMSKGYYTHASPTLFNSATKRPQLSSCFLLGTEDNLEGITNTWKSVSMISKWGGGIGLHVSNIRAKGSLIRGTNGPSSGIIPMLQVYNNLARYINQCFTKSTIVYTRNGPKEIQHVKVNDEIITNDGSFQKIKYVYADKHNSSLLKINITNNYDNILVTNKHPFYVIKNQSKVTNYSVIKNRLDKNIVNFEWCDAENLSLDDFIAFPIPQYQEDNTLYDESDCFFYGMMIGDGHICKNRNECGLTFGIDSKKELIEFTKKYLQLNNINFWETNNESTHFIRWSVSNKFKFTRSQMYDVNDNKTIDPLFLHLPKNKILQLILGILKTDGSVIKEITLEMSSKNIIDSVRYMLLRLGILTSGYCRDRIGNVSHSNNGDIITKKLSWVLRIPKDKILCDKLNITEGKFFKYIKWNNFLLSRITSIEKENYNGLVYDLEINKNHNYLTEGGLVHNGGKRKGSFAIYLEPYHPDILAFLDLRKNFGAETERARDLFLALWIPDLFMEQVEKDGDWYLMCPDECKGLNDTYGDEFNKLYWKYVSEGKFREKLKARNIMKAIMESQIETGVPYMLYKDSCNKKSNQKNLGTIKSSNLCAEILEFSDSNETAVCNLASIAVNKFVVPFNSTEKWKIYTKDNCRYCKWAKYYLNYKKYLFEEIKGVDIKKELNKHTYPQIYYGDQYVGGFEDMFTFCKGKYNYDKLYETAYHATVNLNKVIDINFYPTIESKRSNMKHRPIGLGIQGVADALVTMGIQFESEASLNFNSKMMETIYFAALTASNDISKKRLNGMKDLISFYNSKKGNLKIPKYYDSNKSPFPDDNLNKLYHELKVHSFELDKESDNTIGSYSSFKGSPVSKGILQFDMWDKKASNYDWDQLKNNIVEYGIRNSLVTALMPTASTSQILGNNSCFEFFTNNIYSRKTLAGDFALINKHLVEDLISINEWNNDIKQQILAFDGSISNLNNVPKVIKNLYKNIWEIKQLWVLKNALARAPFVDQTQSMNIFMGVPNYKKLFNSHFWGWKNGLKTGMYYLRSKPSKSAIKFTVDPKLIKNHMEEECEMCSA